MRPPAGGRGSAWPLWVVVSVIGAMLGALAAWRVRALLTGPAPVLVVEAVRDLETIVSATIAAGAQWLLLRRYRLDVYWWVPATVTASVLAVLVVIPYVLGLAIAPGGSISPSDNVIAGGAAVAAAGLLVGIAQALVLRTSAGNIAWAWTPATVVGAALAGALTSALSSQLIGLPGFATLSLVPGVGALLIAASQAPVLHRLLS
ncbi:MAG TPA: hypothetical protein VII89_09875 [Candidatus Dormibacteraeota bacterium]